MKKTVFLGLLAILLFFGGCSESDSDDGDDETVQYTMKFTEVGDWNKPGNEIWARWNFAYQNKDELFNFSNDKVYVITYSFSSNVDIDSIGYQLIDTSSGWTEISSWVPMDKTLKKNTKYNGKIAIIPKSGVTSTNSNNTYLYFNIGNRNVSTPAILSFYKFDFKKVNKEASPLSKWTISDKEFTINTFAEKGSYNGKDNVIHIRPPYNSNNYVGDYVIEYDLSEYKGKKIKIDMSMNVYLKKETWIAWQINSSSNPFYPVVCGFCAPSQETYPDIPVGHALSANTWHSLTRNYTYTVPNTSGNNGKVLYLSGTQIAGAEAYFDNALITIVEQP
jgi:hypothetical protein